MKMLSKISGIGAARAPNKAVVPPVGLEPTHLAPEASALSAELRGHASNIAVDDRGNNKDADFPAANGYFPNMRTRKYLNFFASMDSIVVSVKRRENRVVRMARIGNN